MIGVYNYTVWLTYLSMISACTGIGLAIVGGEVYPAMLCLLLCGLFDAFDGRVARTKKNRTDLEKGFGIQIDSLTDIVAFGVQPAAIGISVMHESMYYENNPSVRIVAYIVYILFVLAGLIRLAYFNVMEEERQKVEGGGVAHFYTGLPITSSSLVFPTILLIRYFTGGDLARIYLIFTAITGFLFVSKVQVKKPGLKGILIMIAIGLFELIALFLTR